MSDQMEHMAQIFALQEEKRNLKEQLAELTRKLEVEEETKADLVLERNLLREVVKALEEDAAGESL